MQYLAHLSRLLYDPVGAVEALRMARPIGPAFVTALVATVVYRLAVEGFARDMGGILSVGGFDAGGAMILLSYVLHLPRFALPVVFLAAIYVPVTLLLVGAFAAGTGPAEVLRRDYVPTLATLLSSWSVALALWIVPALSFADPASPANTLVWTTLPAVTFLVPATVNFAKVANAGYGRAVAVVLLSGTTLFLMRLAVWATVLLSSPLFLLIAILVLAVVFQSGGMVGFITFYPTLATDRGQSLVEAAARARTGPPAR